MKLSNRAIQEFKAMYEEKNKVTIPYAEAKRLAEKLADCVKRARNFFKEEGAVLEQNFRFLEDWFDPPYR